MQAPRQAEQENEAAQHELRQKRARELYAVLENQQRRLSRALERSTDLLVASEDQADRAPATPMD